MDIAVHDHRVILLVNEFLVLGIILLVNSSLKGPSAVIVVPEEAWGLEGRLGFESFDHDRCYIG